MAKRNFYALKTNEGNEVFNNWDACSKARKGHTSVSYKAFATEQMAQDWLAGKKPVYAPLPAGNITVLYTDGSHNEATGCPGYGFVIAQNGKLGNAKNIQAVVGKTQEEGLKPLRNIAGELMGAMKAVQFAVKNGLTDIELRFDYAGVGKWVSGEFSTETSVYYEKYAQWMRKMAEKVNITYVQIPGHSGDYYNEMADIAARKGCGVTTTQSEEESWNSMVTM